MALDDRAGHEESLLRALAKANRAAYQRVLDALGDPPDIGKLTPELWAQMQTDYEGALLGRLEQTFLDAAEGLSGEIGVAADWTLVNERAAAWAREYTFDLVRGINDNSRRLVQQAVSDYWGTGMTQRDLQARIGRVFGAARSEGIAITETTRAAAEGERAHRAELEKMGVRMRAVWITSNDALVCSVCAPLDGKVEGDGWMFYPPAHVRCRCSVRHEPIVETA